MKQNYDFCLKQVLKSEGGYTNDPRDPGGPTNYGITIGDYRRYINPKGTPLDVRNMKLEDAKTIYKKRYWDAVNGDSLPSGVDYSVFDYGVNSGIGRARSVYTRLKSKYSQPSLLVRAICDERLAFLQRLKTWPTFGRGWFTRVANVRRDSLALAVQPEPIPTPIVIPPTPTPVVIHLTWWETFVAFLKRIFHWV